ANTCRPAQAGPVSMLHPSTIFAAVTFWLAKNRPARSSPLRWPPRRRRHTVLRSTICSRIAPPLCRGADLRMTPAIAPSRLFSGCRQQANRTRAASGKGRIRRRSVSNITCAHALGPSPGQAMDAMGTQTDIARAIRDGGGDYCMSLKKNWPAVYADVEQLFNDPPDDMV